MRRMSGGREFNDFCLPDLSSGCLNGDDDDYKQLTYATLTPLRPLSPPPPHLDTNDHHSNGGFMVSAHLHDHQTNFLDISDDLFFFKYNKELESGGPMNGYDFLEPLLPIATFDGTGNVQCCNVQQTFSLYRQSSLLLPLDNDYSTIGKESDKPNANVASGINNGSNVDSNLLSSGASSPIDAYAGTPKESSVSSASFSNPIMPSLSDTFDLNVDMEEVDTKGIAELVSNELKKYNISQVLFAQTILGRSQGTLSDLLRNPKPWAKMKSGRETFCRMWKWLQEPEEERMAPFKLAVFKSEIPKVEPISVSPVKMKQEAIIKANKTSTKPKSPTTSSSSSSSSSLSNGQSSRSVDSDSKKQRMIFSEAQRASLRNFFRKTPRPDRELQLSIARQLRLPIGSVANFFMNARRRPRVKWQDDIHNRLPVMANDDSTTNSGAESV